MAAILDFRFHFKPQSVRVCSGPAEMKLSFQTLVGTGVADGFPDKTQLDFLKLDWG